MTNRRAIKPAIAWLELGLWIVGSLWLGYCAFVWGRARNDQIQGRRALLHSVPARDARPAQTPSEGSLFGRIEIPRLNLSSIVFEGTSEATLARGVGHLTGSAAFGQDGNAVLAAHRDTFFRDLRHIQKGDEISVVGPLHDEVKYVVQGTSIAQPHQTEAVQPTREATLTLITCYPFSYVGSAPKRFIVRATCDDCNAIAR